jgi:hypothetical protein
MEHHFIQDYFLAHNQLLLESRSSVMSSKIHSCFLLDQTSSGEPGISVRGGNNNPPRLITKLTVTQSDVLACKLVGRNQPSLP